MERDERIKEIVDKASKWFTSLTTEDLKYIATKFPDIDLSSKSDMIIDLFDKEGKLTITREETNKEIEIENNFRYNFKYFFQGDEYDVPPCGSLIHVTRFGITDLKFTHTESSVNVDISLSFPGLLIGKGGSTIDSLNAYLNDRVGVEFKLNLIEKDIWRFENNI